ncbi:metalloregulator ArsR/SmtB family transcription factor [Hyphococcus flavus]|uniref:Metalloregulator ArsR/SmtB family transcription factor n=1 Tax=Hyphococcus flavus TaxID=1866326 RepID=A0AAE9ZCL2_9PROT|nr:metalloregulator ArsR/SmtB family transcription factor [Hyphococcus flavus]WDI32284.1 metalloregulator ArsR/SmtB family transcription factor [Hyphococcus flavus]
MPNYEPSDLDNVFQALADPTRRAVLQKLTEGPASVSELAKPFEMALPSFMQHLSVLEESGLVKSKKEGRVRTCEAQLKRLSEAEEWIAHQRAVWEGRLDRLDAYLQSLQPTDKK